MDNKLQTINYNRLGPLETKILDLWASGIHDLNDIVNTYNEKYANDKIRKIRTVDVSKAIRKIKRLVLKESVDDLKEIVIDEYFLLYNEALKSWMNSKEDEVITTEIHEETGKGIKDSVTYRRKPQTGDPRHLSNAARMLESLRQLQGIDAPKKVEHILQQEMVLVMEYLKSALDHETYEKVMDKLRNYGTENLDIIDIEVEKV